MFKNAKKCVSFAVASTMLFTSVFSTSTMGAVVSVDSSAKCTEVTAADITSDAMAITVEPSKSSDLSAGEEFYVDFKIKNNPGMAGYSLAVTYDPAVVKPVQSTVAKMNAAVEVKYDKTDEETGEPKATAAISAATVRSAIAKAENGKFEFNGACLDGSVKAKADGDGVLFRVYFEAVADGETEIGLRSYNGAFISAFTGGVTPGFVTDGKVKVGNSTIKPLDPTMVYIDTSATATEVTSIPNDGTPVVTVTPSNPTPAVDEEFYVDFVLENNPGIAGYSLGIEYDATMVKPVQSTVALMNAPIQVKYDKTDEETGEPKATAAISAATVRSAIAKAENGKFEFNGACLDGSVKAKATGDGVLLRVYFQAVGEGASLIKLRSYNGAFLSAYTGGVMATYVKDGAVTVGGAAETTSESTSESTTESTTEATTEATTAPTTDATTEATTTAPTTVAPTTDATTETTTKRRSSGGGGGSSRRDNAVVTTTKKETTTETTTEEDTEATTSEKTTQKADKDNTTNVSAVSFVTKGGVKVNVPVTNASNVKNFVDVKPLTPWAESAINKLSSAGIINGISATKFNPKGNTTRGDFMVIIAKLLGLEGTPSSNFADVAPNKYYYNAVGLTKQIGIAAGVGNNKFDPEATITRQEVMAITARVLELVGAMDKSDVSVLNKFVDKDDVASYAKQSVANLVGMKIVSGDTNNRLNPTANITRAETAVIMSAVYDIVLDAAKDASKATTTTTEATTEATTSDDDSTESTSAEAVEENSDVDAAVAEYEDVMEYIAAFKAYALDDSDDQGKTLKEDFVEDYEDDYKDVYDAMEEYLDKYADADKVDLDKFVEDTKDFFEVLKEFGDKVDFAVTADDSKDAIKDAKDDIDDAVEAIKDAIEAGLK